MKPIRYDFTPVIHSKHNRPYRVRQFNQLVCVESVPSDEHDLSPALVRQEPKIRHFLPPKAGSDSNSSAFTENNPHIYFFDSIHIGTPNKPVYSTITRQHVLSAMRSYSSVIFAYGQAASGKTFTL
jgi:hypothetical protein